MADEKSSATPEAKKALLAGVGIGMMTGSALGFILMLLIKKLGNRAVFIPMVIGIVLMLAAKAKKEDKEEGE